MVHLSKSRSLVLAALASAAMAGAAQANILLNDNFSTFTSGDLVGQNSWTQLGTTATSPIQVSSGQVVIPAIQAGSSADNQDAYKTFTSVAAPGSGTTSVFVGLNLNISAAQASPSYFLALSDTPTGFANERLTAKDNGGNTYVLGARVTGQAGYPFVYGTTALEYNTTHNVVLEADLVGGTQNDVVKVFVDPISNDLSTQTPYLTETYTSGSGTDPTALGVLILSQFASSTVGQDGVTIGSVRVADTFAEAAAVPEPAALSLAALAGAAVLARRRNAAQ